MKNANPKKPRLALQRLTLRPLKAHDLASARGGFRGGDDDEPMPPPTSKAANQCTGRPTG